jgi:hypothetical protein
MREGYALQLFVILPVAILVAVLVASFQFPDLSTSALLTAAAWVFLAVVPVQWILEQPISPFWVSVSLGLVLSGVLTLALSERSAVTESFSANSVFEQIDQFLAGQTSHEDAIGTAGKWYEQFGALLMNRIETWTDFRSSQSVLEIAGFLMLVGVLSASLPFTPLSPLTASILMGPRLFFAFAAVATLSATPEALGVPVAMEFPTTVSLVSPAPESLRRFRGMRLDEAAQELYKKVHRAAPDMFSTSFAFNTLDLWDPLNVSEAEWARLLAVLSASASSEAFPKLPHWSPLQCRRVQDALGVLLDTPATSGYFKDPGIGDWSVFMRHEEKQFARKRGKTEALALLRSAVARECTIPGGIRPPELQDVSESRLMSSHNGSSVSGGVQVKEMREPPTALFVLGVRTHSVLTAAMAVAEETTAKAFVRKMMTGVTRPSMLGWRGRRLGDFVRR